LKKDAVRRLVDDAVERLAQDLEQGRSETLIRYLAAMSRFHRYSYFNAILIVMQRPDASHVAG